jgi:hypothetical protein
MRSRADLVPDPRTEPMKRPGREKTLAIALAALAAGLLAWGVLAEQIGETLFNATLV